MGVGCWEDGAALTKMAGAGIGRSGDRIHLSISAMSHGRTLVSTEFGGIRAGDRDGSYSHDTPSIVGLSGIPRENLQGKGGQSRSLGGTSALRGPEGRDKEAGR